jgi:hypothetical protein
VGFVAVPLKCPKTLFCFTAMMKRGWNVTQFFPAESSLSTAEPNSLMETEVGADIENMIVNECIDGSDR